MARPLALSGFEFSLETGSLDALESVAREVTHTAVGRWFSQIRDTEEAALLSTCHRVELLLVAPSGEVADQWQRVLPRPGEGWRLRHGRELVRHLFLVAAGGESLAVGEAEVRHQVRAAGRSTLSRHPRPILRPLLVGAASATEELLPEVPPSRSIASAAVARLLDLADRAHPAVLVIGTGTVGRQVAERLAGSARTTLVFHRHPPSEGFLRTVGARAVPLERLSEEVADADAIVTAAKFGQRGIRARDVPRDHPLLLVDLGMPRNIDPEVRALPHVRLVDLQELYVLSKHRPSLPPDLRIEERARRFSERVERELLEPWVAAVRRAAEEVRRSELKTARPFFGRLEPEQEAAVDRLTRRLVSRLLRPPTERMRSFPPGPEGELRRRLAVELLRPDSPDS